jgi:hypothetical protein
VRNIFVNRLNKFAGPGGALDHYRGPPLFDVESRLVPMRRWRVESYGRIFSHMLRNIAFTLPWPSTSTASSPSGLANF